MAVGQVSSARRNARTAALVAAAVFAACLFGILTRPLGNLAVLWPANALLLGLFLRFPSLAVPAGWIGAVCGYILADALTGGRPLTTLLLTVANLAGVVVGYLLLRRQPEDHRRLRSPQAVSHLMLAVLMASTAAGCVGALIDPLLFDGTLLNGWTYWFSAEAVNYIAFLPVVLALPDFPWLRPQRRKVGAVALAQRTRRMLPVLALLLSALLGVVVGGPGAVAFPVPALLWCAVSYSVFATAWLTLLFGSWSLLAISQGYLPIAIADIHARPVLLSIRIGVSLIALAPITVSAVMAARNALLAELQFVAAHDALSGLLNRGAFYERGEAMLSSLALQRRSVAVLMLDIDRFKAINDRYGHAVGDQVLSDFSVLAKGCMREGDVLGRTGGEEFAAVLPDCDRDAALAIARRLCEQFAATPLVLGAGQVLEATVSIGVAAEANAQTGLDRLLLVADAALYRAKRAGRNRVEWTEVGQPLPESFPRVGSQWT